MFRRKELQDFIKVALECSVYVAPLDAGLSYAELVEVGKSCGYQEGELRDAINETLQRDTVAEQHGSRVLPGHGCNPLWDSFHDPEDPDYRNINAFDTICGELRELVRKEGRARSRIAREVLVERAVAKNVRRQDAEVAISVLLCSRHLVMQDAVISFAPGRETYPLASEQRAQRGPSKYGPRERDNLAKVYPLVRDVVGRRSDGRPAAVEALDAFAEKLELLNYGKFRLWWRQTVDELRRQDTSINPVAAAVLSAALVEGALTFVVRHAKGLGLGPMGSKTFDGSPTSWKIDELVSSAASGGPHAILGNTLRLRADSLVKVRQRIHAGRMLLDYPGGPPDLRPEEARDAKDTAELVVRAVIDWLGRHPPAVPVPAP
jgi:hypothetical protein